MKVALCTGCAVGHDGIADYAAHLAAGLRAEGVEVVILPLEYHRDDKAFYARLAAQANQADLCHVQYNYVYFNGDLPYRNRFNYFAAKLSVPLVATVHEVRIGYNAQYGAGLPPLKRLLFSASLSLWDSWSQAYHRKAYARMDRILVHTRGQAERIAAAIPVRQQTISVLPHGVPEAPAAYGRIDPREAKRQLGLEGKTVLAIFGFINKRKGYETALEALIRLDDDVVLLIAGGPMTENLTDQVYLAGLRERIGREGLSQRVKITGYLEAEKIPLAMAAADLCLAPSDTDAGSGSLSVCLSYAKPVAASDIPAHREINGRLDCLALFAPSDSAGLEALIRRCLEDTAYRSRLQQAAAAYAQQYSFRSIAAALQRIYRSLSGEGG